MDDWPYKTLEKLLIDEPAAGPVGSFESVHGHIDSSEHSKSIAPPENAP